MLRKSLIALALISSAFSQEVVEVGSTTGVAGESILLPLVIDRSNPVVAAHLIFKYTPGQVLAGTPIVVDGPDHTVTFFDDLEGELGILLSSTSNAVIPDTAQIQIPLEILSASPTGGPSIELTSLTFTEASGTLRNATPTYPLLEQWRRDNFTAAERQDASIVGDDRDPDQDQIPNLIELAMGLSPTIANDPLFLGPVYAPPNFSMVFERLTNSSVRAAVRLFPEASSDLMDWSETGITETFLSNPEVGVEAIEAAINSTGTRLFLRLNAERRE